GTVMAGSVMAVALTGPGTGAIADTFGRKRVIAFALFAVSVPTMMLTLAHDVHTLAVWRFVQGLFLPAIFAVTVAHIGDEWPPNEVAGVTGLYVTGSSIGRASHR